MSKAEEFLNALSENEGIRTYITNHTIEEGEGEIDVLTTAARHFGYEVTRDDLEKVLSDRQRQILAGVATAEEAIVELSDDQISWVSGGLSRDKCEDTYEWYGVFTCWTTDACMETVITYHKYDKCSKSVNPSCRANVTE